MSDREEFERLPILCLDFDGVIHSYESGWKGADVVSDPVVPGAIEFMREALEGFHFDVQVFSGRSHQPGGVGAMQDALRRWSPVDRGRLLGWVGRVKFPLNKPPALVTLDDRAIQFTGTWPTMQELKEFKPWNKR